MVKEYSGSMEDYLEAIAVISRERPAARVSEMSRLLGVKKPSVTAALKKLSAEGLVQHERYGYVNLTPKGARIAEKVYKRHNTLQCFLTDILGIDPKIAQEDACKIEHAISNDTADRLAKFVEFVSTCPIGAPEWLKEFERYLVKGERSAECMARCHDRDNS